MYFINFTPEYKVYMVVVVSDEIEKLLEGGEE